MTYIKGIIILWLALAAFAWLVLKFAAHVTDYLAWPS